MVNQIADPEILDTDQTLRLWRGFGNGLELAYRSEEGASQGKSVAANWMFGLFFFDFFLVNDYLVTGASFPYYVIGRLGICTPMCIALALLIRKGNKNCDIFASGLPVVAAATLSVLLLIGHGEYRSDYLFGNILLMVSGVTVNRARFRWAAASIGLQCVCFQIIVQFSDVLSREGSNVANLYCLSAASIALLSSATLDRGNRRAFLLRLRVSRLNRELEDMTLKDPLTGLGNRRCLDTAAAGLWADGGGQPRQVGFILLDVDRFKLFNDSYGHPAGDLCLQTIARCVERNIRQASDMVIRFGGEELVVFMPDTDMQAGLMVAERIRRAIVREGIAHPALGVGAVVTASLGVASSLTTSCTSDQLVTWADNALYEAKNNGRNRVWPTPAEALTMELVD